MFLPVVDVATTSVELALPQSVLPEFTGAYIATFEVASANFT